MAQMDEVATLRGSGGDGACACIIAAARPLARSAVHALRDGDQLAAARRRKNGVAGVHERKTNAHRGNRDGDAIPEAAGNDQASGGEEKSGQK